MKNTDEQLSEIMKRSALIKETRKSNITMTAQALSSLACLVLMGVVLSLLPVTGASENTASMVQYGSLILHESYMGYIIMGALAFTLGILVTLLCVQIKKHKELTGKYGN